MRALKPDDVINWWNFQLWCVKIVLESLVALTLERFDLEIRRARVVSLIERFINDQSQYWKPKVNIVPPEGCTFDSGLLEKVLANYFDRKQDLYCRRNVLTHKDTKSKFIRWAPKFITIVSTIVSITLALRDQCYLNFTIMLRKSWIQLGHS